MASMTRAANRRRSGAEKVRRPREVVIGDRLKLTTKWGERRLASMRSVSWRPDQLGSTPWGMAFAALLTFDSPILEMVLYVLKGYSVGDGFYSAT
ncbi:hypothetical protein L484_018048 [Morus notabilis]|uniref:Uncharacterized protein n=1 Tax=Morus notabilis TaxID=981085 RepID=W9RHJ0_9ROSA|nr:hypothetical protein L484_018048 [Morus notabilis]